MNKITMTLQVDHLILEALKEDISSEDVTTNSVMKEAVPGEVDLICKEDGIIAGLEISAVYLRFWMLTQKWSCSARTAMK